MRRVLAIAQLAIREAIRSRVVLLLLALSALSVGVVPFTVAGDGTLRGEAQTVLTYSLGLVWLILSAATLWIGCGAVAGDIRDRQIQLVLSAPVRRAELWLGKWLGIMALNAGILALAGLCAHQALLVRARSPLWTEADRAELRREVMGSHRVAVPEAPEVEAAARERLRVEVARRQVEPGEGERRLASLRLLEAQRLRSAAPGETIEWSVPLPRPVSADRPPRLQYQFTTANGFGDIAGRWWIGAPGRPRLRQAAVAEAGGALRRLDLPGDALAGADTLLISFTNEDPDGEVAFFDPRAGLRVLLPGGGFEGNLSRALLAVLGHLAFLAALGVSAGSAFSLPVAGAVAVFTLVLQQLSGFIGSVAEGADTWRPRDPSPALTSLLDAVQTLFRGLDAVLSPLRFSNPLELASLGQAVEWAQVGGVWAVHGLAYGLLAAGLGIAVLQRREVALPE